MFLLSFLKRSQILILFILFIPIIPIQTVLASSVVFNEIAWMGNLQGHQNEWIELFNPSNSPVNINQWKIISKRGLKINLQGTIKSKSFYLISRKKLPGLKVDLFFKRGLNNKGDILYLIDNKNKIVDMVDCSKGWFAGNNKTKQTMERLNSYKPGNLKNNWFNSIYPEGTPKKENSVLFYKNNKSTSFIASNIPQFQNKIILGIGLLWALTWSTLYFLYKKGYLKIVILK